MGLLEIGSSDKGISLGNLYTGTSLEIVEVSSTGLSGGIIARGKVSSIKGFGSFSNLVLGDFFGLGLGTGSDNGCLSV